MQRIQDTNVAAPVSDHDRARGQQDELWMWDGVFVAAGRDHREWAKTPSKPFADELDVHAQSVATLISPVKPSPRQVRLIPGIAALWWWRQDAPTAPLAYNLQLSFACVICYDTA
jgi:hypothetical protein